MKRLLGLLLLSITVVSTGCGARKGMVTWGGPKNISMLPILAQDQEFFKEEGLDTERQDIQTGKLTLDTLLSGKIDFGVVVEPAIAFVKFQPGSDIKVIAVIQEKYDDAIVARKDKGITRPQDLVGKTLGLTYATTSQMFVVEYLQSLGVDLDKVKITNMQPPSIQAALINGELDAGSMWQPFRHNAVSSLGKAGVEFNDPIYKAYALVAVRSDYAEKNPEKVEKFLSALVSSEEYLEQNQTESQQILSREIDIPLNVLNLAWKDYDTGVSMPKELLGAIKRQGEWIISSQPEFKGKPLPDYQEVMAPNYLEKIDPQRVAGF